MTEVRLRIEDGAAAGGLIVADAKDLAGGIERALTGSRSEARAIRVGEGVTIDVARDGTVTVDGGRG